MVSTREINCTKHIKIDLHFVRERVALGDIKVLHVPTTSQFADIFTKGLPTSVFTKFRSSLNVCGADTSTAGPVHPYWAFKLYMARIDRLTSNRQGSPLIGSIAIIGGPSGMFEGGPAYPKKIDAVGRQRPSADHAMQVCDTLVSRHTTSATANAVTRYVYLCLHTVSLIMCILAWTSIVPKSPGHSLSKIKLNI